MRLCSRSTRSSWSNSPQVDMWLHSDTLSWFRANQSLLFLLNAVCLAEKEQIPILWSLVWSDRGLNPQSTTLEASTLNIMPLMRFGGLQVVSSSPSQKKDQSGLSLLCIHHRCLLKSLSLKLQVQMETNFVRMFLFFTSSEFMILMPIQKSKWLAVAELLMRFDFTRFKKYHCRKQFQNPIKNPINRYKIDTPYTHTVIDQKYFHTKIFPYIFHIKL